MFLLVPIILPCGTWGWEKYRHNCVNCYSACMPDTCMSLESFDLEWYHTTSWHLPMPIARLFERGGDKLLFYLHVSEL